MEWISTKLKVFFGQNKHIILFLWPLGFRARDYAALSTMSESKKKFSYNWYYNNLFFPLTFSICVPIVLKALHCWFGVIPYDKGILEIITSGSLSLSGINILRSTSTMVKTSLDDSQLSEPVKKLWNVVKDDIGIIKNKLDIAITNFTIAGILAYILQIGELVNGSSNAIYICIVFFVIVFVYSVVIGKLIFNTNANYLKDEAIVRVLFDTFSAESVNNTQLADQVTSEGL